MQCAVVLRVGVTIKQINPLGTNVPKMGTCFEMLVTLSRIKNVHPDFFRNFF